MNGTNVCLKVVKRDFPDCAESRSAIQIKDMNVWFNETRVIRDVNLSFKERSVTTIIGPSGSGKSTLIRGLNRINDEVPGFRVKGEICFKGSNIYSTDMPVHQIRKEIGMIFQKPCIFPKSIFENVLFGVRYHKKLDKTQAYRIVEESLRAVSLWKEVSGRLHDKAVTLSVGQQQRLCIARALTVKPEVILMDEPTSALDPGSTLAVEHLIKELKKSYTIIFVTHNIEQARRVSDHVVFVCGGTVIEEGACDSFFSEPKREQTKEFLSWNSCDC